MQGSTERHLFALRRSQIGVCVGGQHGHPVQTQPPSPSHARRLPTDLPVPLQAKLWEGRLLVVDSLRPAELKTVSERAVPACLLFVCPMLAGTDRPAPGVQSAAARMPR